MTSARRRPRRYTELAQGIDGHRDPLEVGCWVVVSDRDQLVLTQIIGGPHHQRRDDEVIAVFWELLDGSWRGSVNLTRLDLAGVLEEATAVLSAIPRGCHPAGLDETLLRIHRAACLARRTRPTIANPEAVAQLDALAAIDVALAEVEQAWRELVRVRLPNLARAIALAGALELATQRTAEQIAVWLAEESASAGPRVAIAGAAYARGIRLGEWR